MYVDLSGSSGSNIARRPSLAARVRARVFKRLHGLGVGTLSVRDPEGHLYRFVGPEPGPEAHLQVHRSEALTRLISGGDLGFAEAYMDGAWDTPDLEALLELGALNERALGALVRPSRALALLQRLRHHLRRNTRRGSRRNIAAHYDLGNDFYRLFLDASMTYSSAVFESPDQSLEDAQQAKYRRIAEGADLRAGMHVLEIGSGWGGFALYAAGELGCRVTSITISREQHDHARERVREAGLEHLVDIRMQDYRDIEGTYDAVVSIEMLEAVGAEYYTTYFEAIDRALRPGGKLSLQVITFPDVAYEAQRRGANWIQTYIFPGGLCPSLSVIERSLHGTRLLGRSATDIGPSYALTLREWRRRFLANLDAVRTQGFDQRFIRMWEYYLALCEAGFAVGLSQDHQIVLEKARGLDT